MRGVKTKMSGTAVIKHTGISEEEFEIKKGDKVVKANELVQFEKLLAKEIAYLENNIVISSPELVERDLDSEFVELMDTVSIQVPAILEGKDFTFGDDIVIQDYKNGKINIVMDKFFDVSVKFTQRQLDQALEKGYSKVIRSMSVAIRQKLDTYTAERIKNRTSGFLGTSGTTPDAIGDITGSELLLNLENAPDENRAIVLDSYAKEKLIQLPEYKNLDMTGSTSGLFNSTLGKKFTLQHYSTNNVPTHVAGGFATLAATTYVATCVLANNGLLSGSLIPYSVLTITESGGASVLKLLAGDIAEFKDDAGNDIQAIVLEDSVAAIAGVVSVKILALSVAVSAKALTFPDHTTGASVRNLIWQKTGVTVVARPIQPAEGMKSISMSTEEGYPLRLTYGYDIVKKEMTLSMDTAVKCEVVDTRVVKALLG
jgi:hypothetical protein